MFMIRGAVVKEVDSCTDERVTYKKRADAMQVLRVAKDLAEQTGIPLAAITPKLKALADFDDLVTPEMVGLADPCAKVYAEMFASDGGPKHR